MHSRVQAYRMCVSHGARGFTLVELMVSISIMVIITGVMVLQFSSFDSTTILRAHAYEVAHSVRAAQGYASSIRGTDYVGIAMFDYRYGISFSTINNPLERRSTTETNIFVYRNDDDPPKVPRLDGEAGIVELRSVPEGFSVTEICIKLSSGLKCNIEDLDISFERPEAAASFYAKVGGITHESGIDMAKIKIQSGTGDSKGVIEVGTTGYISVYLCEAGASTHTCP